MKKAKEATVQYQTNTSISLSPDLMEQLRQAAEWNGVPLEKAAQDAVLSYVGRYGRAKVEQEQAAFEKMRPELLKKYRGQYVAVHNGEVVEVAPDLRSLHLKVYARFGHTPMLHIQVTEEPMPDIRTHGLRLERSTP